MNTSRWVLLAGAAVVVVSQVAPTAAPLYDGIGFPDEAYRYVLRPAGDTVVTRPASSIKTTATAAYGLNNQAVTANSDEQSPQVGLYLPRGSLATPMAATLLQLAIAPIVPTVQPIKGTIGGNAYVVTITSDAGPVTPTSTAVNGVLMMRSSTGSGLVFQYQPPGSLTLQTLNTEQVSSDRYQTRFAGLGTYSLARLDSSKPASTGGSSHQLLLGSGALLALMGLVVALVRRTRARAPRS